MAVLAASKAVGFAVLAIMTVSCAAETCSDDQILAGLASVPAVGEELVEAFNDGDGQWYLFRSFEVVAPAELRRGYSDALVIVDADDGDRELSVIVEDRLLEKLATAGDAIVWVRYLNFADAIESAIIFPADDKPEVVGNCIIG